MERSVTVDKNAAAWLRNVRNKKPVKKLTVRRMTELLRTLSQAENGDWLAIEPLLKRDINGMSDIAEILQSGITYLRSHTGTQTYSFPVGEFVVQIGRKTR
jgi:hypothetical protein